MGFAIGWRRGASGSPIQCARELYAERLPYMMSDENASVPGLKHDIKTRRLPGVDRGSSADTGCSRRICTKFSLPGTAQRLPLRL